MNNVSTFYALIIGKLLGDGSITKQEGRKPRFQFSHRIEDRQWVESCYQQLKQYIPLNIPKYRKIMDNRLSKGFSENYFVLSRTSSLITNLETAWYHNRRKVIPFELLNKYFNIMSLAWWYQDDGSLTIDRKTNTPKKIILSTDSFTTIENEQLIHFLYEKFALTFTLDKQNRLLLYRAPEIHYFLHLVTPYLYSSMIRKTLYYNDIISNLPTSPKRTTLYLPDFINLPKPTLMINEQLNHLENIIDDFKIGTFYKDTYPIRYREIQDFPIMKSYQIIIQSQHLSKLQFLKRNTGLSYSHLAALCFL